MLSAFFDRRPGWRAVLLFLGGSRALIALIGFFTVTAMPTDGSRRQSTGVLDAFIRWDAGWYLALATDGYYFEPERQSNVVFLPVYPLLMNVASLGFLPLKYAGLIASNLCFFAAGLLLWKLIRQEADEAAANASLFLLGFGPVSFFFSILYSEGAFFLGVVGALYAARQRRWWLAGLAGYLAALTRSVGLLLIVPLVVEAWGQQSSTERWRTLGFWRRLACAGLPGLGTLTYVVYMVVTFGDPFVYQKAEVHWGRQWMSFWTLLEQPHVMGLPTFYKVWFYGALLVAIGLLVLGLRQRIRPAYLAMIVVYLVLYTSTGSLEALPRYLSVLAPFYLIGGVWVSRHPRWHLPGAILAAALLVFATVLFATGYWFT